ncbi:MAG: iron-sulfur cluster assembly accessory protein [Patescibacteria group bacterium]
MKKSGSSCAAPGAALGKLMSDKSKKSQKSAAKVLGLTKNAASQLLKLQKSQKKTGYGIRVEVSSGGCAGFQYFLDFAKVPDKTDIVSEEQGFKLFIDPTSAEFLKGTELDYVETLEMSGFQFNNPNVSHSCHCGKSVC